MSPKITRLTEPVLTLLFTAAWGPAVWLLVVFASHREFEHGLLYYPYFLNYILFPTIIIWATTTLTSLSLRLCGRRFGELVQLLFIVISVPIPAIAIFLVTSIAIDDCARHQPCNRTYIDVSKALILCLFTFAFSQHDQHRVAPPISQ